jgi:endonuclease YncB( thermonuclease family)
LFSAAGEGAGQGLLESVTGKAQFYDGVTFDLMQDSGRYRTATRIRLEAVDACELRQKARLGDVDWPCGAVATGWFASRTLIKEVECRLTRVLSGGGYRAQCYIDGTD